MANKLGRILLLGSGLWYFGEGMLVPFLAVFTQRVGGDILEVSGAWAIYLLVIGVLTVIFGKYSDIIEKDKMMVLGYGINAIFTFGYLLVDAPYKLFLVQIGLGIAAALATPTWDALYAEYEDRKNYGTAWGVARGVPSIVTGIAVIIGGLIITSTSFTTLFVVMGIVQVIATLYQAKILFLKRYRINNTLLFEE